MAADAGRESSAPVADVQAADAPIRASLLTQPKRGRGADRISAATGPACHFGFSSTVDVPAHQHLAVNRLLPVTPEVASSSLVDPAISFRLKPLHC
jgi:hypothetical protein